MAERELFRRVLDGLLNPQVVVVWVLGLCVLGIIIFFGGALSPFLTAVVLAYLLEGLVRRLVCRGLPRWLAVLIVFCFFMAACAGLVVWLVPLLVDQVTSLIAALPKMAVKVQQIISELQARYATRLDPSYLNDLVPRLTLELEKLGRQAVSRSFLFVSGLFDVAIYLFVVPLLILLFLKDKTNIVCWLGQFIPTQSQLFMKVLADIDTQLGNFIRGKFLEMVIIGAASVAAFVVLDLRFGVLMGLISGISVLIPYLGILMAIPPILLVALFQWGLGPEFFWAMGAFAVIQLIDGNILVHLLMGKVVRIHPAAIIFAVLVCGRTWGFLGVLFALPVAIVVKSLIDFVLPYFRPPTTAGCETADDQL